MIFPIIIMIILSAIGLSTLLFTQKIFPMFEIIAYFMIISVLIQQVYSIFTLNLEMIKISEKVSVFWFMNMYLLIILPCITLWLLYSYFSPTLPLFIKALLTAGWLIGMFIIEQLFDHFGFYTFKHWNIGYSFIESLIILIGSVAFIVWFRKMLRKQAII